MSVGISLTKPAFFSWQFCSSVLYPSVHFRDRPCRRHLNLYLGLRYATLWCVTLSGDGDVFLFIGQFSFFLVNTGRRSSICRVPMEKMYENPNDLSRSVGVPHHCILWPHSEKCHQTEDGVRHFNSVAPTWSRCWLWFVLRPCDNLLNCPSRRRQRVMFVKEGANVSSWNVIRNQF